jgi:hypothetical protein
MTSRRSRLAPDSGVADQRLVVLDHVGDVPED